MTLISESLGQDDAETLNTDVQVPAVHEELEGLIVADSHNFPEWKSMY